MTLTKTDSAGFTLLEILISMALLVVISYAIWQATTKTFQLRDTLANEGDFFNGIRLSMSILERDIIQIYSPVAVAAKDSSADSTSTGAGTGTGATAGGGAAAASTTDQQAQKDQEEIQREGLDHASQFWGGMLDLSGIRPSRFVGDAKKMTFVSTSNIRMYKETRASDFAKITYEAQADREDHEGGTQVLSKTEDTNAFDEDDQARGDKAQYRKSYPLLHGIKKISFTYYWKEKDHWYPNWDTESRDTKNIYPDAIRVHLEVSGPTRLFFEGDFTFRPEFPLGQKSGGLNPSY